MSGGLIVSVTVAELMQLKTLPDGCVGVEVVVPKELQELKRLLSSKVKLPIAGFRMGYIEARRYDILQLIDDFDRVCHLAQIASQIARRQYKYIYINLASHYPIDFYVANNDFTVTLSHNLTFLQNIYNYVIFVIDNVQPYVIREHRTIFSENGGSPVDDVVQLFRDRGCTNVFTGMDCKAADNTICATMPNTNYKFSDYVSGYSKLITLGDDKSSFCRSCCYTLYQMNIKQPIVIPNDNAIYKIASEYL